MKSSCNKDRCLRAAKNAAASGDHLTAQTLFQDAIFASDADVPDWGLFDAYIGLADSTDALGENSGALRAVAAVIKNNFIHENLNSERAD
jgi:hypothetical protein